MTARKPPVTPAGPDTNLTEPTIQPLPESVQIPGDASEAIIKDNTFLTTGELEEPTYDAPKRGPKPGANTGRRNVAGAWMTYSVGDEYGYKIVSSIYADEMDAMRDALANNFKVIFVAWGQGIEDKR